MFNDSELTYSSQLIIDNQHVQPDGIEQYYQAHWYSIEQLLMSVMSQRTPLSSDTLTENEAGKYILLKVDYYEADNRLICCSH